MFQFTRFCSWVSRSRKRGREKGHGLLPVCPELGEIPTTTCRRVTGLNPDQWWMVLGDEGFYCLEWKRERGEKWLEMSEKEKNQATSNRALLVWMMHSIWLHLQPATILLCFLLNKLHYLNGVPLSYTLNQVINYRPSWMSTIRLLDSVFVETNSWTEWRKKWEIFLETKNQVSFFWVNFTPEKWIILRWWYS